MSVDIYICTKLRPIQSSKSLLPQSLLFSLASRKNAWVFRFAPLLFDVKFTITTITNSSSIYCRLASDTDDTKIFVVDLLFQFRMWWYGDQMILFCDPIRFAHTPVSCPSQSLL